MQGRVEANDEQHTGCSDSGLHTAVTERRCRPALRPALRADLNDARACGTQWCRCACVSCTACVAVLLSRHSHTPPSLFLPPRPSLRSCDARRRRSRPWAGQDQGGDGKHSEQASCHGKARARHEEWNSRGSPSPVPSRVQPFFKLLGKTIPYICQAARTQASRRLSVSLRAGLRSAVVFSH